MLILFELLEKDSMDNTEITDPKTDENSGRKIKVSIDMGKSFSDFISECIN